MKVKEEKYVMVKLCNSATCEGGENGCTNGDCLFSNHHKKSARWRKWTVKHYIKIFGREPNRSF